MMGYPEGNLWHERFIKKLNATYAFLHKFEGFSRSSYFWEQHSEELTKRNQKIRDNLNNETLLRKNPKSRDFATSHISVTDLSSFIFCPASCAIKLTYDVSKTDEIDKSDELRDGKLLEEFLTALRRKRSVDFILSKMKKTRDEVWSIEVKEIVENDRIKLNATYKKPRRKSTENYNVDVSEKEFFSFINRGYYGEILQSNIVFRGHNYDPTKSFFNKNKTLSGIPDYILENKLGQRFVLLEKHTWRNETISSPYSNHIIQTLGYLIGIEQLNLHHGYILYLHSKKLTARLYKITVNNSNKDELRSVFKQVINFKHKKSIAFEKNTINIDKCFNCSVRMYCYHKSGDLSILKLPYNIK